MLNKITKFICLFLLLSSWQAFSYTYTVKNQTNFHIYFELSTLLGSVFVKGTIPPMTDQPFDIPVICIQSANARAVQPPNTTSEVALPAAADAASYGAGFECKNKNINLGLRSDNKINIAITD
jgi:hypothetical protein